MPNVTQNISLQPVAELHIPKPIEEILAAVFLLAFVSLFAGLAIHNLREGVMRLPSAIWLLLVGAALASGSHVEGPRGLGLDLIGSFAPHHYLWLLRPIGGTPLIQIGFTCFAFRLARWTVPIDRIERVSWTPGQGTAMSGRDVNDWSVGLWWHPCRQEPPTHTTRQTLGLKIAILGPTGPRTTVEALGRTIAGFLQESGVPLVESHDRDRPVFERASPTPTSDFQPSTASPEEETRTGTRPPA